MAGERIDIGVEMVGMAEAVAGLTSVSAATTSAAAGMRDAARSGATVAAKTRETAAAEATYLQAAQRRGRMGGQIRRMGVGGAMLGMMGLEAGMSLAERAFGEGGGGGAMRAVGGVVSGTATGAMTGGMIAGVPGAIVGGTIGLISSTVNAVFASMETQATHMADKFAKAAAEAARLVDTATALSQSWGLMGDQLRGSGTSLREMSEAVGELSESSKLPEAVIIDLINRISDRALDATSVTNALRESHMKAMAGGMHSLGLTTDQMAEIAVAADAAQIPLDLFLNQLLRAATAAKASGEVETVSEYAGRVAGGMSSVRTPMQAAAAQILGPGFLDVTAAVAASGATPEQIAARQRLGVTAGMGAEQTVGTLAGAVAAGGTLEGTGLERFQAVLGSFGEKAESIEALAGAMETAREVQEALTASNARMIAAADANTVALRAAEAGLAEIAAERSAIAAEREQRNSYESNREIVGPRR